MADQKLIFKEWMRNKLSTILKFHVDVPDYLVNEIMESKSDNEVEASLKNLLNHKDPQTKKFISEVLQRRRTVHSQPVALKKDDSLDDKYRINNKSKQKDDNIGFDTSKREEMQTDKLRAEKSSNKKKNKFVNFYTKDGEPTLLKGRYICNCESKKHKLINNCLTCGRIVCEQEGSGPCYVCGSLVCTPEEQLMFNGDTGKASKLYEQLLTKEKPKGLAEALQHRDKLLEFDKNSQKHTHVFDDDCDYYLSTNPWLTLEEREQIKKNEEEYFNKKHASRKNKKINLRIEEGGKLVEEKEKETASVQKNNIIEYNSSPVDGIQKNIPNDIDHLIDPYFSKFNVKFKKKLQASVKNTVACDIRLSHIMDTEIHQMKDEGYCLSVHQPWASFLVNGIRDCEGRSWYTPYRGKLWIASTGTRITRQEAAQHENTYRLIKGEIKFPADYPAGCLIGCVDLVNCLSQEQYRSEFPDGEIEDPYVFICENPQVLPVRYPIKGKPNIYKLDEKIHAAAVSCLKTVEKVLAESEHKVKSIRP